MSTGRGKTTKDLEFGTARNERQADIPMPRETRVLRPFRSGKEISDALIRNWEDVCRVQQATYSALSPELETLASDRKSERLVTMWVDDVLGEDASAIVPERPLPSFHESAPPAPTRSVPVDEASKRDRRVFQLSPGRRFTACLLGVAGVLSIAFVAVPSPRGLREAIFEKVGFLPVSFGQKAVAVPPIVSITLLAPENQTPWMDSEIVRFNQDNTGGYRVTRLQTLDGKPSVPAVLAGAASPTVFAPDRTGDVERLNIGWLMLRHPALIADIDDPAAFRRVSHLPLVVLNAPWVNARQRAGGIAFLEFLAKERGSR